MYRNILVPIDGKHISDIAIHQAIKLAKLTGATLTCISVIEYLPAYAAAFGQVEDINRRAEAFYDQLQKKALEKAIAQGIQLNRVIRSGTPSQVILSEIKERKIDLVVIGAENDRRLGRLAEIIADESGCTVLITRSVFPSLLVRDLMTSKVVTVQKNTPISDLLHLMLYRGIKAVPVIEGKKVLGLITGGDLLERAGIGLRLSLQRILPAEEMAMEDQKLAQTGKTAADIMTSPVITISQDEMASEAARIMVEKEIKRLPVLDDSGSICGIISRLDVISILALEEKEKADKHYVITKKGHTAADILVKNVPAISPNTSLNEVMRIIISNPLRRAIVVDQNNVVLGLIADSDLLKQSISQKSPGFMEKVIRFLSNSSPGGTDLSDTKAADVMEKNIIHVLPDVSLSEVVEKMKQYHIKRVLVTDDQKHLLGMVDRASILQAIASL